MSLLDEARKFLQLASASKSFVDLSEKEWLSPLEILPIASAITTEQIKYVLPKNQNCREYLTYFNFPHGLDTYKKISNKYISIYRFLSSSTDLKALEIRSTIISNVIQIFAKQLGAKAGIMNALHLVVDEMISNIEEYAKSQYGWIHGQYYPSKKFLDSCLVDRGITIRGSYAQIGKKFCKRCYSTTCGTTRTIRQARKNPRNGN